MIEIRTIAPSKDPARVKDIVRILIDRGAAFVPDVETEKYVDGLARQDGLRLLVAEERGEPVGWLGVMTWSGGFATLHPMRGAAPGRPTVVPGSTALEVGRKLVCAAENAVSSTARSILACIDADDAVAPSVLRDLAEWYGTLGYHFADLVHFIHGTSSDVPTLPPGVSVAPLRDLPAGELADCILEVFSRDAEPFFCAGSDIERSAFLRSLPTSPAMAEKTSVGLRSEDEIIGFATTGGDRENGNLLIDWMGIRPAWRRHGYGRFLLRHILGTAGSEGYATASLSCDRRNASAMALYESEGWEVEGGEHQFAKQLG